MIRPHLAAVQQAPRPAHSRSTTATGWPGARCSWPTAAGSPRAGFEPPTGRGPWVGLCDGQPACALVGPEQAVALEPNGVDAWFDELAVTAPRPGGRRRVDRPPLGPRRQERRPHRARLRGRGQGRAEQPPPRRPLALVGPSDRLFIHETARIDPYTVFDTTNGPITVGRRRWVQPFTRVEGPCYIGRDTQLFRANIRGGVTIGPNCRIGGEVEASIVHGYSNKYHEGFLGHAYVGEWVNLGAITSNSDLRNDYGEVSSRSRATRWRPARRRSAASSATTPGPGMGSMLNTGTAIGVMCNVLPAGPLLPKHVPSFTAVLYGRVAPGFPLEQMFATARIVMGRRGQTFTEVEEQLYADLYEQTRLERERAFLQADEGRADHQPILVASASC